jgi:tripartite-type tricarboxylate transporter receptor subunit TctC
MRMIVPFPAGGPADIFGRGLAQGMSAELGQPVIVENIGGVGGVLGVDRAAKSPPDGYTLGFNSGSTLSIAPFSFTKLPYDVKKDFGLITLVVRVPEVVAVHPSLPVNSLADLIRHAKANPGKVNFGSSGIGAAAHLTTELLKQTASIDMVHVPFKGTAPALTALMAGDIQVLVDVPSSLMPHARGGKIRALAMFSGKRIPGAPEVPTVAEAGGPPLESSTWVLFLAPAGTPRDIVMRLSTETRKAINESDIKERFTQIGIEAVGNSPEEAAKFLRDEVAKWAKVITTAGVKAEQ